MVCINKKRIGKGRASWDSPFTSERSLIFIING
jgi:hypothetical protein